MPQANPSTQALAVEGLMTKQATSTKAKSAERTVRNMAEWINGMGPFCSIFGPTLENKNEARFLRDLEKL
tara:strand:+ start:88 stop:297 length:210 start_codon:yes stop_codon:yes gene_type:complete